MFVCARTWQPGSLFSVAAVMMLRQPQGVAPAPATFMATVVVTFMEDQS